MEADGVIRRNVPFSSRRNSKQTGLLSPSPSRASTQNGLPLLKNSPSLSSIQTAQSIMQMNPYASRQHSLKPNAMLTMRESTTQLSMKLRKVVPDHQKNMIVSNMQGITADKKHQKAFTKKK